MPLRFLISGFMLCLLDSALGCSHAHSSFPFYRPTMTWCAAPPNPSVYETGHRGPFSQTSLPSETVGDDGHPVSANRRALDRRHRARLPSIGPTSRLAHLPTPRHGPPAHLGRESSPRTPRAQGHAKTFPEPPRDPRKLKALRVSLSTPAHAREPRRRARHEARKGRAAGHEEVVR